MNEKVRLGYACVNMTLTNRPNKLGGRVTTSRTARKATWQNGSENSADWDLHLLGERTLLNANDLLHYLKWNNEHKIKLFRLGSELFPWHDHYELCELPQFPEIAKKLFECGEYAKKHRMRITTHPGPYNVLGSPNPEVVRRTIISLERHSETFDIMGFEPSFENKINIHVGGSYGGDFDGTSKRWIENWHKLSDNCKKRLVLENDDKPSMWSTRMLYHYFHKEIGIPITFDYHHHTFHPDELTERQALELAGETWPDDVRQCCHYSESRAKEKQDPKIRAQAHSDYIRDKINTYGHELDIVIEAKAKELALFEYRNIYQYNNKKVLV
jgi:UV DNA damage endonuclease